MFASLTIAPRILHEFARVIADSPSTFVVSKEPTHRPSLDHPNLLQLGQEEERGDCDFTNDLWGSRAGGMIGSNSRIDLLRCVASK